MPKNQNHDTPSTALRTASCLRVSRQMAMDSGIGFQLIFRSGAPASTRGIMRDARLPVIASTMMVMAATTGPWVPARVKIRPPKIMPTRMDMEVPISTRPLPPVSSSGFSTEGMMEYFTGPNSVDCTPVQNSATSSTVMFWVRNPAAANVMMTISMAVVMRISRDFSSFSANCPAMEENRKYGRMKMAGASCAYSAFSSALTAMKPSRPMMACRYTLSLKAPSAWTRKNGRKRRCFSSEN